MTGEETENEVTILLTEDDDGHAQLIAGRLAEAGLKNEVLRFRDGETLLTFLSRAGRDASALGGRAYLVLLDIRMPGLSGIDVLKKIRADARLSKLPVIMLTTSDDPRDINECYALGSNNYLSKPVDTEEFTRITKRLGLFLKGYLLVLKVPKI